MHIGLYIRVFLSLLFCCTSFVSCISESIEPCPPSGIINNITFTTITLDTIMPPYEAPFGPTKQVNVKEPDIRFIICAYTQEGILQDRKQIIVENNNQSSYQLNIPFYLPNGNYRFVCWADYVVNDSVGDWFYDTTDLSAIASMKPYVGNTDWKDAFTIYKDVVFADPNSEVIEEKMLLRRPFAKFQIIATDLDKYIRNGGSNTDDITVGISYLGSTYNGYDAFEGEKVNAGQGNFFLGRTDFLPSAQLLLGWDYVWMDEQPATQRVSMVVYDGDGIVINTVNELEIPCRLGRLTTVSGAFLTENFDSGIGIITEYEGDINVLFP